MINKLKAPLVRSLVIVLVIVGLLGLFLVTVKFSASNNASETERAIKQFRVSTKESMKASELLGDGWDRLCVVGDYAEVEDLEKALGRNLKLTEHLLWLRYANTNDWVVAAYEKDGEITRIEMMSHESLQRGCHDYGNLSFRKERNKAGFVSIVFSLNQ